MAEETLPGGAVSPSICPWCSATYAGTPANCPSCDATLTSDGPTDAALPGLTAIDPAAIVRAKEPTSRPRNRILSWISGEYPEDTGKPGESGALAPPDAEVKREILRLELEAEVAALQAEAGALMAEAAAEGRVPTATPQDAAAAETIIEELQEVSSELEGIDAALDDVPLDRIIPDEPAPEASDAVAATQATEEDARPA